MRKKEEKEKNHATDQENSWGLKKINHWTRFYWVNDKPIWWVAISGFDPKTVHDVLKDFKKTTLSQKPCRLNVFIFPFLLFRKHFLFVCHARIFCLRRKFKLQNCRYCYVNQVVTSSRKRYHTNCANLFWFPACPGRMQINENHPVGNAVDGRTYAE